MLELFYVCYFVVIGVSTPFFGPYLRQLGLSGQSTSAILSVAPMLQIGVPLAWGWLSDRSRRPNWVLRGLFLGAKQPSAEAALASATRPTGRH